MLTVTDVDLYYGASQALRRVSLSAPVGQVSCVLGRNGVGKSSLLRAIIGHQRVSSGRIEWEGFDVTAMAPYERAAHGIALVPQGREIFPMLTVEENLKTGFAALSRARRTIPNEIFELFPVLAEMMHRRGGDLSGGQQQQLAIGRALVMRPRLLLLDEPTEGIQPSIIKDIRRVIRRLAEEGTQVTEGARRDTVAEIESAIQHLAKRGDMAIVLVEQYFEFARDLADRYTVLDRGEVVLDGAIGDMVESDVRRYLTV
ncbi:MAG: ABC transporter ATP-binding protein [Proteobacteria bacterium]|nr:ABC transporter ATP-binding protein [Pseudomonadota bacterium]